MKYIKLIILLVLLPFLSNAQATKEHFAAYGDITGTSVITTDTFNFTINTFSGNSRPYGSSAYIRADVQIGDKIISNCNHYIIKSITQVNPNLAGTMYKVDAATPNPTNFQRVAIIRESTNAIGLKTVTLPPTGDGNSGAISGISIDLAACIIAHYSVQDSSTNTLAIKKATEVSSTSSITFPTTAWTDGDPQVFNYGQGRVLYPIVGSNGYSYVGEYAISTNLLVALDNGSRIINFDKAILVKANGDRFRYDLPNNEWIPADDGYLTRTTGTMPVSNVRAGVTGVNDAERFNRIKNTTDGQFYKWNGTAFVVETTDAETKVLSTNPTTQLAKSGDIAVVETSGGDTVRIQQITTTKIKALGGKMTALPSVYTVSGTQTIDYSEATIEVGGLNYKVNKQSNKWGLLPDQTAALASFPDATLSTLDLRKTSLISSTDSAEYKVKTLQGTTVQRWHRVSDIVIRNTGVMPVDSFTSGSNIIYNRGADVKRYGLNTNNFNSATTYISTETGGWQPITGELNAIDFGLLTATTNKQRRVALQTMVDSAILAQGVKQGFILCRIPQGDFMMDSTLHLGYGNQFSQLILRGAGRSYRGENFRGTVLRVSTSDQQIIDIAGARGTIVEQMSLIGLNNYTVPTGSNRSNINNYLVAGLHANANSRYAPHAGITLDGYSVACGGSRQAISYPDIPFLPHTGFTRAQTYTFQANGSGVVIRDVMFFNLVVGIVNQPSGSDCNGDFTKIIDCHFDQVAYDVSVCQTQSRNTIIRNCEGYGEYTSFTTVVHGKQNGRINLIDNYSGGGSYQAFNIGNMAVNTSLYVNSLYIEDVQRLGIFGSNASTNSSVVFNGGVFQGDLGTTPSSGANTNFLQTNGTHNITFNSFTFTQLKHLHFNNSSGTRINLNECTVITEPLYGEVSGVSATDTQRLFFRRATGGVTASEMEGLIINSTRFSDGQNYYFTDDFGLRGNNRMSSSNNINFLRINAHEGYDIRQTNQADPSVFNFATAWGRGLIDNRGTNFVGRRFAMVTDATTNKRGYAKGDLFMCTGVSGSNNSLVLMVDTVRTDSMILTLMNNYNYNPSTGAFVSYIVTPSGGAGSPLDGNNYWYTGRAFISIQPILGYFTANSQWVTGLKKADGTAMSNTVFDKNTPLFGGRFTGEFNFLDEVTSIDFVSTTGTDSIHITRSPQLSGWFPIGNTFDHRIYPYINNESQSVLTKSTSIPTRAGNIGDFIWNKTSGTTLLGWYNKNGNTTWTPVYLNSSDILTGSVAFNSAITAGAEGTATATITGAAIGNSFSYSLGATDLPTGVVVKSVRVTATNTVVVTLTNTTASTQTPNVTIYLKR